MRLVKCPAEVLQPAAVIEGVRRAYGQSPLSVMPLSEGAFGVVYLVMLEPALSLIAKVHRFEGWGRHEADALRALRTYTHNHIPVPEVHYYQPYDAATSQSEMLLMDYIKGLDGRRVPAQKPLDAEAVVRFGQAIVAPLLTLHTVEQRQGFGPIGGAIYTTWWDYYRQRVETIHAFLYTPIALQEPLLSSIIRPVATRAFAAGSTIFAHHCPRPTLLHGDYALGNLIVNPDTLTVVGVLDPHPVGVEWGDRELDTVHLTKSSGHLYRLYEAYLEGYQCAVPSLQQDAMLRLRYLYYMFWTWLAYYALIGLDAYPWYTTCAQRLAMALDEAGY